MRLLRMLLVSVLALGLGIGIAALAERPVEAQWGYGWNTAVLNNLLTTDGTDVTLESGQLLLPNGTNSLPALSWSAEPDTGIYRSNNDIIRFSFSGTNRWNISNADFASITSGGASIRRSAGSASGTTYAFLGETDSGLYLVGASNLGMSVNSALVMDWEDTNAAGASADLVTISFITGIMNGSEDIVNALSLNVTSADHTGGVLNALKVGSITGDAHSTESLFFLGDGYDYFINDVTNAALGTTTWTTNSDKDGNTASGTLKVWINDTLYHVQLYADS